MTKKLVCILIILIVLIITYVFAVKYDTIMSYISNFISTTFEEKVVVSEANEYKRNYQYISVSETSNFIPSNKEDIKKIFYTILNNGWESFTFYCPNEYASCTSDVSEITNDNEFISLINNYVSPFNAFYNFNTLITNNKSVYITIDKLYKKEDIEVINEKLDAIIRLLNIDKNNVKVSDIETLHNYILNNTMYDKEYDDSNYFSTSNKANGVLVEGKAVCSGYADAFALMMDKLNIRNYKVSSEDHVWNVIYVNNKWVHVDTTWDDDEYNINNRKNFFMVSTNELYDLDTSEHTFNKDLYLDFN